MLRFFTYNHNLAMTFDNLTFIANRLYRWFNFHFFPMPFLHKRATESIYTDLLSIFSKFFLHKHFINPSNDKFILRAM